MPRTPKKPAKKRKVRETIKTGPKPIPVWGPKFSSIITRARSKGIRASNGGQMYKGLKLSHSVAIRTEVERLRTMGFDKEFAKFTAELNLKKWGIK